MDVFKIKGHQGYIYLSLEEVFGFPNETSHFGGYDVRGVFEVRSCYYFAKGELWFSTGEVFSFYNQLKDAYKSISGEASFINSEANAEIKIVFNAKRGHVVISGYFKEQAHWKMN
ncbi:hypothetical protein AB6A23_09350 [Paenibacillus tarimensis]